MACSPPNASCVLPETSRPCAGRQRLRDLLPPRNTERRSETMGLCFLHEHRRLYEYRRLETEKDGMAGDSDIPRQMVGIEQRDFIDRSLPSCLSWSQNRHRDPSKTPEFQGLWHHHPSRHLRGHRWRYCHLHSNM